MKIDILTLFPEMFAPLNASMLKRAQDRHLLEIQVTNIRDFAEDKHQTTDDRLYGGGAGMVMKPEPLAKAVEAVRSADNCRVLITSPAGKPYTQRDAEDLAKAEQIIIVCGHYEGIDQRFIDTYATDIFSVGDFVLTGGEIPAMAIADSVSRLLPGVLGDERAAEEESFSDGLLEYPQYTRPPVWQDLAVPAVLQQGNHQEITRWRRKQALERTLTTRPDLLSTAPLTEEDAAYLGELRAKREKPFQLYLALLHYPVYNKKKETIATSLTNLDLHDIARLAKTYALAGYFVVQPMAEQREMVQELLTYWHCPPAKRYNPYRSEALDLITLTESLEMAIQTIQAKEGQIPRLIATGAGISQGITHPKALRQTMESQGGPYLLLLGTGYGLVQELISACDYRLQPIFGKEGYNHLSVRSAAAILLDRLLSRD